MTDTDYSKNDFIDINNRLFRIARNKISENSKGIKDLDDDNKTKGEKNLLVYGSELINNLNQINYTFKQLEDYIFVPIKGKTKKDILKIIEKGPTTPISELKESTPLLDDAFEGLFELFDAEGLPDLETPEILPFQNYTFISLDKLYTYTLQELEEQIRFLKDEIDKIVKMTEDELVNENIPIPEKRLDDGKFIDDLMEDPKIPSGIKTLIKYLIDLNLHGDILMKLIKSHSKDDEEAKAVAEPVLETTEPVLETTEPTQYKIGRSAIYKPKIPNIEELNKIDNADIDLLSFNKAIPLLKKLGFTGEIDKIASGQTGNIKGILKSYLDENKTTGAGRRIKGGVGIKGMKKGVRKSKTATPTTPTTSGIPTISTPVVDEEEDYEDETDPADELKKNEEIAKKLDKTLKDTANTSQRSPIPGYITKIYELMTNLVQFIGRTNVLYISRIKKNLNYLDEDQVKLIYTAISKFKDNLQILKDFKNKGSALIKDTLYNQVEKETLNLYNEIYNSIRNYSTMKDYTVMAGSGMVNYMDPLSGGYFIQSDSPFIRHSTTKRFL